MIVFFPRNPLNGKIQNYVMGIPDGPAESVSHLDNSELVSHLGKKRMVKKRS